MKRKFVMPKQGTTQPKLRVGDEIRAYGDRHAAELFGKVQSVGPVNIKVFSVVRFAPNGPRFEQTHTVPKSAVNMIARDKKLMMRTAEGKWIMKKQRSKPAAKTKAKLVAVHWTKTAAGRAKHAEKLAEKKRRERATAREKLKQTRERAAKNGHKFVASYARVAPGGAITWAGYVPFSSSSIAKTWARNHALKAAKKAARGEWIVLNNKTGATVAKGTEHYVKPANY